MNNIQQLPAVQPRSEPEYPMQVRAGFDTQSGFELLQRMSKAFGASDLVPQQYRNNISNCMIALDLASRIGAAPLLVMQNLYIVHGTPGWSAKFLIATINQCGRFSSLRYEWKGEAGKPDFGCRAWAIETATGERLDGIWVTWAMVKAEGWDGKSGSKWKTMPDQMFVYRAAAFWQRAYAPELGMGLQTVEDLHDVVDAQMRDVTPTPAKVHVPTPTPRIAAEPTPEPPKDQAPTSGEAPAAAPDAPPPDVQAEINARLAAEAQGQPAQAARRTGRTASASVSME